MYGGDYLTVHKNWLITARYQTTNLEPEFRTFTITVHPVDWLVIERKKKKETHTQVIIIMAVPCSSLGILVERGLAKPEEVV